MNTTEEYAIYDDDVLDDEKPILKQRYPMTAEELHCAEPAAPEGQIKEG